MVTAPARAVWDLVALGDSYTASSYASWPEMYAGFIEEDLGVGVEIHNMAVGGASTGGILDRVRNEQHLRELLAGAEVITVGMGMGEFRSPIETYARGGGCGGRDNRDCLREARETGMLDFEALLDELVALRSPDEALIVTFKKGAWPAELFCDWGSRCWTTLARYFVDLFDAVEVVARERGVEVIDALGALHAPGVFEAPIDRTYLQADRLHLSDEGSAVIAGLLRDLGYG
jgi:lysophospholipase L1-like esterase